VAVTKDHILEEIRRLADASGGKPPGRKRFAAETGIQEHDWSGRYWARWSDAVAEAGFEPNQMREAYPLERLLGSLVAEIRRLGRMPTNPELRMRRREDRTLPNQKVFERLGPKAQWPEKIADYCRDRPDDADVLAIVEPLIEPEQETEEPAEGDPSDEFGFVYLLKSGRHYKIGRTLDVGRRRYDLAIKLPEAVTEVHAIKTDDPAGIESYWHRRFADRHMNGEWFELTAADVAAFRRRKFM
jgi:hypothetical protein